MQRPRIRAGEGQVLQLRVELMDVTPAVWRRLVLAERASLEELHLSIEGSMRRDPVDGYGFVVDGIRYTDDHDGPRDPAIVALQSLGLHPGMRFEHTSGALPEPWRHVITIEAVTPRLVGQRVPSCTAGARAAPPEGCAGPAAYRELLRVWHDPFDPRAAEWRSHLADRFAPDYADLTAINAALARIPKRRPAA